MPKGDTKTRQPELASGQGYCRKCRKIMPTSNFYETTIPMIDTNGYMSVCKSCCNKIYDSYFALYNNMEKAMYYTCQDLDLMFSKEALKHTQTNVESLLQKGKNVNAVFGIYKSKLSSTCKINSQLDSLRFVNSDSITKIENNIGDMSNIGDFQLTDEMISYWGKSKEPWEYEFLDNEMTKITASFECPDYGMEMIMRDICFINLNIERIRLGLDKGDITKLIETRSKLMNDAKMKPIQATGAESNEQVTFGTLIKKWETEKPIPVTLDDEMKKYIDTYMIGHLAKMQGFNCELVAKYERAIKEYTIDFNEIDSEDDE